MFLYTFFVEDTLFLSFLKGTLLEKNHWWYTLFWSIGAVLFLTVFSFVSPSVFFVVIACGITIAAIASFYLDEPNGAMAEIMPDGTVQMIDVH